MSSMRGPWVNAAQDLDPQPGQLRLAVQDARTGLVGTITAASP